MRPAFGLNRPLAFFISASFFNFLPTAPGARPSVAYQQQQPAAPSNSDDEVIRVETNLVTLPVVVTDKRGRRVTNLARADFALSAGDGSAVPIEYFATGTRRVALVYALDASGSSRDTITQQRETALALFARFGRGSQVAVTHFDDRSVLAQPFTDEAAAIRRAFQFEARANRRTAVFDAALAALRAFDALPTRNAARRIAVLLTDGLDTISANNYAAVINEARLRDVSFYVVNLSLFVPRDGRLAARRPSRGVRELAERTGGKFFRVGEVENALNPRAELDLNRVFQAIAEDLESQYAIGYYAPGQVRSSAPIAVQLVPPKDKQFRVKLLRQQEE